MRQNVKILLSVFLLMSICMVMASPPYPESQNEDKTEIIAIAVTIFSVVNADVNMAFIIITFRNFIHF